LAAINEHQARQSQRHQHTKESNLDFLATHPPEFTETTDPLEANHLIHVTVSKFGLLHCSKFQKTLFVAQQLYGSASAWWATYTANIQDNHQVPWNVFCTAFCEHHISAGIMHHRLQEFLDLQQGSGSVYEYIKKFNYLTRYSTHHVDTDDKKIELFRKGLSLPLRGRLVRFHEMMFNALVSAVVEQEGTYIALLAEEEKKRKRVLIGLLNIELGVLD
jgi:hypothetical protein